jgi:hypothetical protein
MISRSENSWPPECTLIWTRAAPWIQEPGIIIFTKISYVYCWEHHSLQHTENCQVLVCTIHYFKCRFEECRPRHVMRANDFVLLYFLLRLDTIILTLLSSVGFKSWRTRRVLGLAIVFTWSYWQSPTLIKTLYIKQYMSYYIVLGITIESLILNLPTY